MHWVLKETRTPRLTQSLQSPRPRSDSDTHHNLMQGPNLEGHVRQQQRVGSSDILY